MSRRQVLRLFAGAAATAVAGSWLRPDRAFGASRVAAADPGCSGIRTAYGPGCSKPVPKLGYKASFNGCGPENGVNIVPNTPLGVANFHNACNAHDICYGTCNSNKDGCDSAFFSHMKAICTDEFPGDGIFDSISRGDCLFLASVYAVAVSQGGKDAYDAAQKQACDCCNDCPGGAVKCSGKCCLPGQFCNLGYCCSPCIPPFSSPSFSLMCPADPKDSAENFCGFRCCYSTFVCCPNHRVCCANGCGGPTGCL